MTPLVTYQPHHRYVTTYPRVARSPFGMLRVSPLNREGMHGTYVSCAQCGHVLPPTEEVAFRLGGQGEKVAPALASVTPEYVI